MGEHHVDLVGSKPARSSQERANQAVVPFARGGTAATGRWSNSKRIPSHRCNSGGSFEGERLSGEVVTGNDWQDVRKDSCIKLEVGLVLKTTDGALIIMTYQCLRAGTPGVMEKLDRGEDVDPTSYYFRINPVFETSSRKYDWMNRILAVGIGHRPPDGPIYNIFEVL